MTKKELKKLRKAFEMRVTRAEALIATWPKWKQDLIGKAKNQGKDADAGKGNNG